MSEVAASANQECRNLSIRERLFAQQLYAIIFLRVARDTVDVLLPSKGGDSMVTYEALTAFATVGMFVIAVITLLMNSKH